MNKKIIYIVGVVIVLLVTIITLLIMFLPKEKIIDENTLYTKEFGKILYRFERYDYILGQNVIVGVEKSTDKGKTYTIITKEPISVSNEAEFAILSEDLMFAIGNKRITRTNDFLGLKVSKDGGSHFVNAKINYDNPRVDIIDIVDVPYYNGDNLELKCSIYDIKKDNSGYEDIEIVFVSNDDGLTWNLKD